MLTADILVSYPERSTSFNRYTYALNNPLRFVDPTGWDVETCTPSNPSGIDSGYTTSVPKDAGQQSTISMDSVVAMNYGEKLQPIQNQATIKPWRHPGDDSFQQDLARSNLDAAFSMGGDAVISIKLGAMIAKFAVPITKIAGKAWAGIAEFAKSVKTRLFGVADTGETALRVSNKIDLLPPPNTYPVYARGAWAAEGRCHQDTQ